MATLPPSPPVPAGLWTGLRSEAGEILWAATCPYLVGGRVAVEVALTLGVLLAPPVLVGFVGWVALRQHDPDLPLGPVLAVTTGGGLAAVVGWDRYVVGRRNDRGSARGR